MIKACFAIAIMTLGQGQDSSYRSFYTSNAECKTLKEPALRLACYDKVGEGELYYIPKDIKSFLDKQSSPFIKYKAKNSSDQMPKEWRDKAVIKPKGYAAKKEANSQKRRLKGTIYTEIVSISNAARGEKRFHASDGSIWQQAEARGFQAKFLPFQVSIKKTFLGGFSLKHLKNGQSSKVKLLRGPDGG